VRISPAQNPAREEGFVLIEILVSALVLVVASAGVMVVMQTTTKTQAEQRHGSEAYSLAQEDQARLASMRLSTLNRLNESRTITLNKTTFSVRSRGLFINDTVSTPSCNEGTMSADYVEITTIVTWTGMDPGERAKIVSILSPSNGSLDPNNGTVAVSVKTQAQAPVPNVYISGGSGAFTGYTDAAGCAVFSDLAPGNYLANVSGEAAGVVNKNGSYTEQKSVPVVSADIKTVTFEFDRPGTIPVNFKYRVGTTSEFKLASADSLVAYNSGMSAAKSILAPSGLRAATVNAAPLFPFSSTYLLYAGSCASNNPNPEGKNPGAAAAMANVVAPAGGTSTPATLQLPALDLVVKNGGSVLAGAKVTLTDTKCESAPGTLFKRVYTSNAEGKPSNSASGVAELGLPWGIYDICVSANISGTDKRKKVSGVTVQSLSSAAVQTVDLNSSPESGKTCS
jgi:type II secretory pathway pseudopilin PulG